MKKLKLILFVNLLICQSISLLFGFTYPDICGIPDFLLSGYQRGLGDIANGFGARSLSMGSTGITSSDEPSTLLLNPAGLSTLDLKMLSFGFGLANVTERVDTISQDIPFYNFQNYFHFNNIAITYPLSNIHFGFGFFPVSNFQYKHKKYYYSNGKATGFKKIISEGIVYSVTPAISFKTNFIAVGFVYNSYLGDTAFEIKDVIYATKFIPEISTKTVLGSNFSGGQISVGSIIFIKQNARLGFVFKPSFNINNKYETIGSTIATTGKIKYNYPFEIDIGLAYFFDNKSKNKVLIDFLIKKLASFEVGGEKISEFRNFSELHVGVEHGISQNFLLRYGFYYQPYYAAKEFEKVFITAGCGFNLSTILSIDVAGEYGKRDYRFIDSEEKFWDVDQRIDESIKRIVVQGKIKW
ncbi:MAG: hypothetical protein ABID79_03865 [Elusimicrobiota bacterium]